MRVLKVLLPPPQKMDFWPQNDQIWPKTGIFGPFDIMPDQKTMGTSCLGGYAFLDIMGQILAFVAHCVQCPTKTRLTFNCAHLRSTKESQYRTVRVDI